MVANTPLPAAFLIEYRDGFNATVLMLQGYVSSQACEPPSLSLSLPLSASV